MPRLKTDSKKPKIDIGDAVARLNERISRAQKLLKLPVPYREDDQRTRNIIGALEYVMQAYERNKKSKKSRLAVESEIERLKADGEFSPSRSTGNQFVDFVKLFFPGNERDLYSRYAGFLYYAHYHEWPADSFVSRFWSMQKRRNVARGRGERLPPVTFDGLCREGRKRARSRRERAKTVKKERKRVKL
jgi:hypothetical protein